MENSNPADLGGQRSCPLVNLSRCILISRVQLLRACRTWKARLGHKLLESIVEARTEAWVFSGPKLSFMLSTRRTTEHVHYLRRGVDLADRIAPHTRRLRFLVGFLNLAIELMGVPANNTCAKIMRFYGLLKIVKMEGRDIDPRFRLVSAVIEAGLESVKCGLLMYILLDDMPSPVAILCIPMAFAFMAI